MASKLAYVKKKLAVICVFPDAGTYINHYIQVSSNGGLLIAFEDYNVIRACILEGG